MLHLTITIPEQYDDVKEEFIQGKQKDLQLEHSLVSLSKWEAKWCKPFLSKTEQTREETIDYIRCMTITQNVDPEFYNYVTDEHIEAVNSYISNKMTATWFPEDKTGGGKRNNETVTSELIYFWMITHQIPFKCEKWHLNRLLTLIRVCNVKNAPSKKMSNKAINSQYHSINEARKKAMHTKG